MAAWEIRGMLSPASGTNKRRQANARSTPAILPIKAWVKLSVSSWRITVRRVAPIAERTAISRWRSTLRARTRLAMFAQAMSRTKKTAAKSINIGFRASPVSRSSSGRMYVLARFFSSGYCAARALAMESIWAWAAASVTPSLSRPIAFSVRAPRWLMSG